VGKQNAYGETQKRRVRLGGYLGGKNKEIRSMLKTGEKIWGFPVINLLSEGKKKNQHGEGGKGEKDTYLGVTKGDHKAIDRGEGGFPGRKSSFTGEPWPWEER